jgi:hypothetical protein
MQPIKRLRPDLLAGLRIFDDRFPGNCAYPCQFFAPDFPRGAPLKLAIFSCFDVRCWPLADILRLRSRVRSGVKRTLTNRWPSTSIYEYTP